MEHRKVLYMAKKIEKPELVKCSYEPCSNTVDASKAISYGDLGNGRGLMYFCCINCALAKLFGIVKQSEMALGIENAR